METNDSIQNPIESAIPTYSQTPASSFHKLKYVALSTLILAAGFAGGFYFGRNVSKAPEIESSTQNTPTSVLMTSPQAIYPTPESDEMVGWKTYVGAGFTFKHPSAYAIQKLTNERVLINNDILVSSKNSFYKDCRGACPVYQTTETVPSSNGAQITKIIGHQGGIGGNTPQSFIEYEILNNAKATTGKYITITLWELPQNIPYQDMTKQYPADRTPQDITSEKERELDQILSTFEFVNTTR